MSTLYANFLSNQIYMTFVIVMALLFNGSRMKSFFVQHIFLQETGSEYVDLQET